MEQLKLFDLPTESDGEIIKIVLPLTKKNVPMIVFLWIKNTLGDLENGLHSQLNYCGKFAVVWDKEINYWREQHPFEDYGVLKGVEYMIPSDMEKTVMKISTEETEYFKYFNHFKLPINTKIITEKTKSVSTITTKQNRIPNAGMILIKEKNNE